MSRYLAEILVEKIKYTAEQANFRDGQKNTENVTTLISNKSFLVAERKNLETDVPETQVRQVS